MNGQICVRIVQWCIGTSGKDMESAFDDKIQRLDQLYSFIGFAGIYRTSSNG